MKSKSFFLASGIVLLLVLIHVSFLPARVAAASSEPIIVGVLVPQQASRLAEAG